MLTVSRWDDSFIHPEGGDASYADGCMTSDYMQIA